MANVKVRLGDIRKAAAEYGQKMRRAPAGARGSIAPNTLLRKEGDLLMVDTPFLTTGVPILTGRWAIEVAVHPKNFSDMLETCTKIWKEMGGDNAEVWIEADGKTVSVVWEDGKTTSTRSIPSSRA